MNPLTMFRLALLKLQRSQSQCVDAVQQRGNVHFSKCRRAQDRLNGRQVGLHRQNDASDNFVIDFLVVLFAVCEKYKPQISPGAFDLADAIRVGVRDRVRLGELKLVVSHFFVPGALPRREASSHRFHQPSVVSRAYGYRARFDGADFNFRIVRIVARDLDLAGPGFVRCVRLSVSAQLHE